MSTRSNVELSRYHKALPCCNRFASPDVTLAAWRVLQGLHGLVVNVFRPLKRLMHWWENYRVVVD